MVYPPSWSKLSRSWPSALSCSARNSSCRCSMASDPGDQAEYPWDGSRLFFLINRCEIYWHMTYVATQRLGWVGSSFWGCLRCQPNQSKTWMKHFTNYGANHFDLYLQKRNHRKVVNQQYRWCLLELSWKLGAAPLPPQLFSKLGALTLRKQLLLQLHVILAGRWTSPQRWDPSPTAQKGKDNFSAAIFHSPLDYLLKSWKKVIGMEEFQHSSMIWRGSGRYKPGKSNASLYKKGFGVISCNFQLSGKKKLAVGCSWFSIWFSDWPWHTFCKEFCACSCCMSWIFTATNIWKRPFFCVVVCEKKCKRGTEMT